MDHSVLERAYVEIAICVRIRLQDLHAETKNRNFLENCVVEVRPVCLLLIAAQVPQELGKNG
jgi:hypothetical protein